MAGAPGYVHISQRARTAAASQMAAAAGGAAPMRRRPGMRRPGAVEAGGAPQQVRADRRLNPQDPGVSSEARGFVLYVGLGEAKAAANGTTLVEIRCTSTDPERAHRIAEAELSALDSVARDLSSSGQAGNTTASLKVVDSPTTPSSRSSLSAVSTALIGTAIGLAAGAIMAILLYFLSQKNPQDKVEDPLLIIGRRRSREDA